MTRAGRRWFVPSSGIRRQPGRARSWPRSCPPRSSSFDQALRVRLLLVQQARGDDLAMVRDSYARQTVSAEVAPFFPDLPAQDRGRPFDCRDARARRRLRNSPPSGAPPSWCRFPMRSIRINPPMRRCSRRRAVVSDSRRASSHPRGSPPRSRGWPATPERLAAMAAGAKSAGAIDAADRLADLVLGTIERGAGRR